MSFMIIADPKADAAFRKMWQKDSVRFGQIEKKLIEPAENPEIGKPLKTAQRILAAAHRTLRPHIHDRQEKPENYSRGLAVLPKVDFVKRENRYQVHKLVMKRQRR